MSLASTLLQDVFICAAHSTSTFSVTTHCSAVKLTLGLFFMSNVFGLVKLQFTISLLAVQLSVLCISHSLECCLLDDQIDVMYQ